MSVLVLGATGFIGNAVCVELLRLGYHVYGTTRKEEKATALLNQGIEPVVTGATEFSNWESLRVDVVIECLGDYSNKDTQKLVQEKLCSMLKERSSLNVVFTSGAFGYGYKPDDPTYVFSEGDGYALSYAVAKARIPVEAAYREAGAIIVNPAMVYGGGGGGISYTTGKICSADGATVQLHSAPGDGSNWYSTIHVGDLARLYGLVVKRARELRGDLFNGAAFFERYDAICDSIARCLEGVQVEYVVPPEGDAGAAAWGGQLQVDGRKARRTLGWNPLRLPFAQCAAEEVAAYQRAHPKAK